MNKLFRTLESIDITFIFTDQTGGFPDCFNQLFGVLGNVLQVSSHLNEPGLGFRTDFMQGSTGIFKQCVDQPACPVKLILVLLGD